MSRNELPELNVSASIMPEFIIEFRINYCLKRVGDYRTKAADSREKARKYPYAAIYHNKRAIAHDKEADEWQKVANELESR